MIVGPDFLLERARILHRHKQRKAAADRFVGRLLVGDWPFIYWNEESTDNNYLFATMDTDLKRIFVNTHETTSDLFVRFFGEHKGGIIENHYDDLLSNRVKPIMTDKVIHEVLNCEQQALFDGAQI